MSSGHGKPTTLAWCCLTPLGASGLFGAMGLSVVTRGEEGHGSAGGGAGGRLDPTGMWDGPVIACHSDPVQPSTFLMQIGEEHEEEEDEEDYDDYDEEDDEEEPMSGPSPG